MATLLLVVVVQALVRTQASEDNKVVNGDNLLIVLFPLVLMYGVALFFVLLEQINFPRLVPAPDYAPENAETGTQNQEGMVGAGAAIDFLASLGGHSNRRESLRTTFETMHARNSQLFQRLWQALSSMPRVTLYGPPPDAARTPTLAFTIEGCTSTGAARRLAEKGLFLSHGDFYAATVITRLGLEPEGLIRAGCACYTTAEEIDRLITAVGEI